jgi:hypothetical protein
MKILLLSLLLNISPVKNHIYTVSSMKDCSSIINTATLQSKTLYKPNKYYISARIPPYKIVPGYFVLKVTKREQGFYIYELIRVLKKSKKSKGTENIYIQINKYIAAKEMWERIKNDYRK